MKTSPPIEPAPAFWPFPTWKGAPIHRPQAPRQRRSTPPAEPAPF